MLTIDGARLEGGGQLVRTAVALSALTGREITIGHIRAGREKPGLSAQHIAAVRAVATLCRASCTGLSKGSSTLTFLPGKLEASEAFIEVGTAGSIPLVLQAWLPAALRTGGAITVTGGTEVPYSPTIDYFEHLTCRALCGQGAIIEVSVDARGYFPVGGGRVTVRVSPAEIRPFDLTSPETEPCGIISCSANLPRHVTERQAKSAAEAFDFPVSLDSREGPGTGSSCTVFQGFKGGTALGKRGLPAEEVGATAAGDLRDALLKPGCLDSHLADQLAVMVAIFGGRYTTSEPSMHLRTVLWLLREFGFDLSLSEIADGLWEVSA